MLLVPVPGRASRARAAGALAFAFALAVAPFALRADDSPESPDAALPTAAVDCPFGVPDRSGARLFPVPDASAAAAPAARASLLRSHTGVAAGPSSAPVRVHRGTIDVEIFGKMEADGVRPAGRSSDPEFLRRVTLDLTGRIPDTAALIAFVADEHPDKRARLVDALLASEAFDDRWTMWLGDLLENVKTTAANGIEQAQGRNRLYAWLRASIAQAKPWDQLVRELLTGSGDSFAEGPPNYWVRNTATMGVIQDTWDSEAAASGAKFLGMQINCTGCHNGAGHTESVSIYLSTKTRMDFWKNAAFFAQTTAGAATDAASGLRKFVLLDNTTGSYQLNTTSGNRPARQPVAGQSTKVAPAFYLTGETPQPGKVLRDEYARMLTGHPQFARAAVNYLWREMFGLGIVEPVDGFDLYRLDPGNLPPGQTLQPSHPALLAQLARDFVASGYDLRTMLRSIATSEAYQLSARYTSGPWSPAYARYFARRITRRMTAEQVLDAVNTASGVFPSGAGGDSMTVASASPVALAMLLPDPREGGSYAGFLNTFLRGDRDVNPRSGDASALQALALMNDGFVMLPRVRQKTAASLVARTLSATSVPEQVVDALWLAALSRFPTAAERATAAAYLRGGTLGPRTESLQWALFNKLEFAFY